MMMIEPLDAVKNKMDPSLSLVKFMVYGPNDHSITTQQVLVPCPVTMGNSFSLNPLNWSWLLKLKQVINLLKLQEC